MSSKKSIVFLVPGFPQNEEDTTCIPALQLYIKHFHSIHSCLNILVIAFQYPFIQKNYFWNEINIYSAGGKGRGKIFRLITWLRVIKYFIKIKYKFNIAGIHSFWLNECAFIGQLLSRIFHIPHIATIMGQDAKRSNKYLQFLYFRGITITSVSKFAADIFEKSINWKTTNIIPFGIDSNDFCISNDNRDIDIIGVGSLIPLKNYNLFVEIICELVMDFSSLKVILIGDGELKHIIEKDIVEKGLSKNIQLIGKIPRSRVLSYMMRSKIFLHTSNYESQGLVFLESLYCGLYIVSFNVGYLPASKKISACSSKTEMLYKIKELLCSEKGYKQETYITIEETVKKYNEIYSKLAIV
jgi:glycosyltransferase involved in cell wall biosynthesis